MIFLLIDVASLFVSRAWDNGEKETSDFILPQPQLAIGRGLHCNTLHAKRMAYNMRVAAFCRRQQRRQPRGMEGMEGYEQSSAKGEKYSGIKMDAGRQSTRKWHK